MITVADIIKSANRILSEAFPRIPRFSHDTEEGFPPGCFFVETAGVTTSFRNERSTADSVILRIHYFPESRYINITEILQMQEKIRSAFGPVLFVNEDFAIPINEIEFTLSEDHVLVSDMTLDYYQLMPEEGADIEELIFN